MTYILVFKSCLEVKYAAGVAECLQFYNSNMGFLLGISDMV